jgi:hypothetical protein
MPVPRMLSGNAVAAMTAPAMMAAQDTAEGAYPTALPRWRVAGRYQSMGPTAETLGRSPALRISADSERSSSHKRHMPALAGLWRDSNACNGRSSQNSSTININDLESCSFVKICLCFTSRHSAQHPDAFLTHVLDLAPGAVLSALQRLRQSLKNLPVEVGELPLTIGAAWSLVICGEAEGV